MALDKLKELIGEDLYNQVSEKLGDKEYFFAEGKDFIPVSKFNEINEAKKHAEATLTETNKKLADLEKSSVDVESFKKEIQSLKEANLKTQQDWETKLLNQSKEYELDRVLTSSGARNKNALKGMLDLSKCEFKDGKYTGLDDQITTIKKENEWLFNSPVPSKQGVGHNTTQVNVADKELRKKFGLK